VFSCAFPPWLARHAAAMPMANACMAAAEMQGLNAKVAAAQAGDV
jgi:hypothetical protein